MNKIKLIVSSAYAAIITIVFVVVITAWGELSAPLKDWLKNFSGHHWTSKSIFSVFLYAVATGVLYGALRSSSERHLRKSLISALVFTVLGVLALTAFYTGHHFGAF